MTSVTGYSKAGADARFPRRFDTVANLLASTGSALGTGSTYLAEGNTYREAASGATDHHVTTAGGVKLYVVPINDRVRLSAWGVDTTTSDIGPALLQAASVASAVVVHGSAAAPLHNAQTRLVSANLIGIYGSTIKSTMLSGQTITMDDGRSLKGVKFTSDFHGPSSSADAVDKNAGGAYDYGSRAVYLNTGCRVEDVEIEYASHGIVVEGPFVTGTRVNLHNIRHYKGWGAALHHPHDFANHCHWTDVEITDTDRGTETEAGASFNTFERLTYTRVGASGYTGQPVGYEVYTFVADCHSHGDPAGDGSLPPEPACVGNVYRDVHLIDCWGGITCVRSSGTTDISMPRGNLWDGVTIEGSVGTAGYQMVQVQGHANKVRRLRLLPGSGISTKMHVQLDGSGGGGISTDNEVEIIEATGYALPLVKVGSDNSCTDSLIDVRGVNAAPSAGSGVLVDVYGPRTRLDLDFQTVTGTGGYLSMEATATGSRTRRFRYTVATGETFAQVVALTAQDAALEGVSGVNNEVAVPDIVTVGGVVRGRAVGVISRNAAALSVNLGGASSQFDTSRLDTTLGTITDSGVNSRIARHGPHGFIGSIDDPALAAFVTAQSTTTPIVWPSANLGIGTRIRVNRRSSLTRFRFKVVTQSGNYYAAVCDTNGKVLWKTTTSVPAAGIVSQTMTGVEVSPGDELVLFLALSSATAAVAGLSLTAADQNLFATVRGAPHAVSVANLYTTNTAVGATITLGSTLPAFQPVITLIET